MSTGKSPSGATTTTSQMVNPTQQAQLPFLTGAAGANTPYNNTNVGWNQAYNLSITDPYTYYPGTTLAPFNPYMSQGYNDLGNTAATQSSTIVPAGNSIFTNAANGGMGVYNSPAYSGLSDIASGTNAYLGESAAQIPAISGVGNSIYGVGTQAGQTNTGLDELQKTASGYYLNSNPYLDDTFNAASDAVTRAYQTATAPQTASNFSTAGRYGSGAYANSVSQNQQDLGGSLDNLSSNIYYNNYNAERARQDAAASAYNTGLTQNYATQGNLYNMAGSQYANSSAVALANLAAQQNALNSLQSGYQYGNQAQLAALGMMPSLMAASYVPAQQEIAAGQGLTGMDQAVVNDQMARYYGEQQAPWTTNQMYLNQIGQPTTGSGSGSTTSPYFTNDAANMLGMGLGGLSLYNGLGTAFGTTGSSAAIGAPVMGTFGEWSPLAATAAPTAGKGVESTLPFMMKA